MCQYLYFCTIKASKLSAWHVGETGVVREGSAGKGLRAWTQRLRQYLYLCTTFCVSICTFVLAKQVN